MNREDVLLQEDKNFLLKTVKSIFKKPHKFFKKELVKAISDVSKATKASGVDKKMVDIINRYSGLKLNSITDLRKHVKLIEARKPHVNEGFGEWWKEASSNAYNALAFYPLLTMFLELDKVIKGLPDASLRVTIIYLLIWVLIISGKIQRKDMIQRKREKEWNKVGSAYKDSEDYNKAYLES